LIWISCGGGGLAAYHCVCQKVFGFPSNAFVAGAYSPVVSWLSTYCSDQPCCGISVPGPEEPITYAPVATPLVVLPLAAAIALIVVVALTVIAAL
jgi:hypothetical protein